MKWTEKEREGRQTAMFDHVLDQLVPTFEREAPSERTYEWKCRACGEEYAPRPRDPGYCRDCECYGHEIDCAIGGEV